MAAPRRPPRDDLVARVVAWHNRNPLARRITAANVVSVGLVSFPFFAPAGQTPARSAPAAASPVFEAPTTEADAARPAEHSPDEAALAQSESLASSAADATGPEPAGASSLRERARARAATLGEAGASPSAGMVAARATPPGKRRLGGAKGWQAAFRDDLLSPYTLQEVARWALRHGSWQRPGPAEAPVRELDAMGSAPRGGGLVRLWVFTAAIDFGAQRVRVLVAPNDARRALGPRIIGRGRMNVLAAVLGGGAAAAAASVLFFGTSLHLPGRGLPAANAPALAAAGAASAVSAAASAAVAAPAASAAPPAIAAPVPVQATAVADPPAQAAAAPALRADEASAERTPPGQPKPLRHIVPFLSEAARQAAREQAEALRAQKAERSSRTLADAQPSGSPSQPTTPGSGQPPRPSEPVPPLPPTAPTARADTAPAAGRPAVGAATPAAAAAWAVSTRNLRTRFESEQMLAALRDVAYRGGHGSELKLEVLPAGEDWRAVGWPLASRADAERLRAALAARGLKAEVVQF